MTVHLYNALLEIVRGGPSLPKIYPAMSIVEHRGDCKQDTRFLSMYFEFLIMVLKQEPKYYVYLFCAISCLYLYILS